jgi:hypothetical protein
MCKKMAKITKDIYMYRPLLVRRFIVLQALGVAYATMHFSGRFLLMSSAYFVSVSVIDTLSFHGFGIKGSDYANAVQVMDDNQEVLEGLDKYADSPRKMRLATHLD